MMRTGYVLLSLFALLTRPASAGFLLKDEYVGRDFLNSWEWQTIDDPTHGRVNYVDQSTALAQNLTFASDNKFVMRADYMNIVPSSARGRNSIRIQSRNAYTDSVTVLDLQHMPEGCGTWPAFWSLSQKGPWPHGGEIDIIEGVNLSDENLSSLHTTPDCTQPALRAMTGNVTSTQCDAKFNFNQGCGVQYRQAQSSYGAAFNHAGGGFFAMHRTKDAIKFWFWRRHDPIVPPEIRTPGGLLGVKWINPTPLWGPASAAFVFGDNCNYKDHFDAHAFVFDLTFCGDWAGNVFGTSGCPGNCVDYVNNNPQDFVNAYWEVNSLRVYVPE